MLSFSTPPTAPYCSHYIWPSESKTIKHDTTEADKVNTKMLRTILMRIFLRGHIFIAMHQITSNPITIRHAD